MENCQAESSHKHYYNTRIEEIPSSDDPSTPQLKIIGLNDDCLVKVFDYLSLLELFNVAIANEWLRPAAAAVYKRRFGGYPVTINKCCDVRGFIPPTSPYKSNDRIDIFGLKMCLRYLRCFGEFG